MCKWSHKMPILSFLNVNRENFSVTKISVWMYIKWILKTHLNDCFLLLYVGTNTAEPPWIWFVKQTRIKQLQLVNNLCMNLNLKGTLKKGISKIAVVFYSHSKMSPGCQLKLLFDTCRKVYIMVTNVQWDAVLFHSFRLSVSMGGLPL